jgi:hypothetical protein
MNTRERSLPEIPREIHRTKTLPPTCAQWERVADRSRAPVTSATPSTNSEELTHG